MENKTNYQSIISEELIRNLTKEIEEFKIKFEILSEKYEQVRKAAEKINLDLDKKNEELKQSLKKQEEIQLYLNSILESMNNGVIGVNIMGAITHFNKAASEITQFSYEEVIGRPYTEVFPRNSEGEKSLLHVLRTGMGLARDEKIIWRKDGNPVPVSYQTSMLKDPMGFSIGAVEIFYDISRIKALEEEMQHAKTMAALGEMAATVAHEIRNPLSAMGMWLTLLDRDIGEQKKESKVILNRIMEGLSRLNRIVSNLLIYSRPIKPQFREIVLQQILDETINFVEIEIEREGHKIQINKQFEKDPVVVLIDPEKLQQVIMNLSINAIQSMQNGGILTVSVGKPNISSQSNYGCFYISDTGCGIKKEDLDKIWAPFFTTKTNGTGLGLAIVKKIIESHSGIIEIESEINKGTCVKVFLPLAKK